MKLKKWTSSTKKTYRLKKIDFNKFLYEHLDKGDGVIMATQIMATPILYGKEAKKVMREIRLIPSEKSKQNGKKLLQFFNNFICKDE